MIILITEEQFKLINEHYDRDQLYNRDYIVNKLKKGPKELKKYINKLPEIPCEDENGNTFICTKIPEVIYVYLKGNY